MQNHSTFLFFFFNLLKALKKEEGTKEAQPQELDNECSSWLIICLSNTKSVFAVVTKGTECPRLHLFGQHITQHLSHVCSPGNLYHKTVCSSFLPLAYSGTVCKALQG